MIPTFNLNASQDFFNINLKAINFNKKVYRFKKYLYWLIPKDLRDSKIERRFWGFLKSDESFLNDLLLHFGGARPTPQFLTFIFKDKLGFLPWELIIKKLNEKKYRENIILIRQHQKIQSAFQPQKFTDKLKILILLGSNQDSEKKLGLIETEKEANILLEAWDTLDFNLKNCIEKPIVQKVTTSNLLQHLQQVQPHILWFSGHGRLSDSAELLFADNKWVKSQKFSAIIMESPCNPLYYVFNACEINNSLKDSINYYPELLGDLQKVNALSILGMQSRIKDFSAQVLAKFLFSFLSLGMSLEFSLARARSALLDYSLETDSNSNIHPLDWASPTIWNSGQHTEIFTWNIKEHSDAISQFVGTKTMEMRSDNIRHDRIEFNKRDVDKVNTWIDQKLTLLILKDNSIANQYNLSRLFKIIQRVSRYTVIKIHLNEYSEIEKALQDWAKELLNFLIPTNVKDDLAFIINTIAINPKLGWNQLLKYKSLFIIIENPPVQNNWFWDSILSNNNKDLSVLIKTEQYSDELIGKFMNKENFIDQQNEKEVYDKLFKSDSKLVLTMALINTPLGWSYYNDIGLIQNDISNLEKCIIKTSNGPILTSNASKYFLEKLNVDLRNEIISKCLQLLTLSRLSINIELMEKRFKFFLEVASDDVILNEADILIQYYRQNDRPYPIIIMLEHIGSKKLRLSDTSKLCAAWAFMQYSELQKSSFWLSRSHPQDKLEKAWKCGLEAEISKGSGNIKSKERALEKISEAIVYCKEEIALNSPNKYLARKRYYAYKQDKARILHFLFYKLKDAKTEYEDILEELSNDPNSFYELAIVKRNYAECLINLSGGIGDQLWQKAKELLNEAIALADNFKNTAIYSEIRYEQSKMFDLEKNINDAKSCLDDCIDNSLSNKNLMMLAIAENRLFWKYKSFNIDEWKKIEENLSIFSHGWAIRTLIDSRFKVINRLNRDKDKTLIISLLNKNLNLLKDNPSFNTGTDQNRIANTLGCLYYYFPKKSNYMNQFNAYNWSSSWLTKNHISKFTEIWKEALKNG